jgi:hypothetical protein
MVGFNGDNMTRPWNGIIYENDESPWSEYAAFEEWVKSLLPEDCRQYYDDAPCGFSSYLYAGLASAFDKSNAQGDSLPPQEENHGH